jgi:uncharacterized protein YjdB
MLALIRRAAPQGALCAVILTLMGCASSESAAPSCTVSAVQVNAPLVPLRVGGSATLAVQISAERCSVQELAATWSSSAPAIVAVSAAGVITAAAPGRATIRAVVRGVAGGAEVLVEAPVAIVEVAPVAATVVQGETLQLTATARDALGTVLTGRDVTWASLVPAVATVTADGRVTGVSPAASVAIRATSEGRAGTATITVVPLPRLVLDSVHVAFSAVTGGAAPAAATLTIYNGGGGTLGTLALAPVRFDAGATGWLQPSLSATSATPTATLTLRISNTVLPVGQHTATVTLSALAQDSPRDIVVTLDLRAAPVGSVVVAPATLLLAVGAKQAMTATVRDADGAILTGVSLRWSSTNPVVAAIDSVTGLVTAASVGVSSVRASAGGVSGVGFVYTGSPSSVDGTWRGSAGTGRSFAMTILFGRVTSLVMGLGTPLGSPCALSYSASPLTLVGNNAFAFSTSGGTSNATVSGHFLSSASAQGTYGTVAFDRYVCPPNLLVSGSVPGGSWTAAKQ